LIVVRGGLETARLVERVDFGSAELVGESFHGGFDVMIMVVMVVVIMIVVAVIMMIVL
jgi:hypothetical protein